MLLLQVILVIAAFLVLILSGAILVRNAIGFVKTVKMVMAHVEPKTTHLMSQADAAQRRVLSINEARDLLERKTLVVRKSLAKLQVLFAALAEAWQRLASVLGYVGM